MSPPASPVPPGGGVGTPGGDASRSSRGGFAPVQAAGGQGYIYVVDPALQVEIERLRETVADRERIIDDMEMGGRHNLHAVSVRGQLRAWPLWDEWEGIHRKRAFFQGSVGVLKLK